MNVTFHESSNVLVTLVILHVSNEFDGSTAGALGVRLQKLSNINW
jgi:hypothetical protein